MMKLTYIFHSGFAIETERCILIIDYWVDPLGVVSHLLKSNKPLYVLSSHFHLDHFNPLILKWKEKKAVVRYLLSKDILKHKRAHRSDADAWLVKGDVWQDHLVRVTATGSTDSGVSWIIEVEGKRIFHAGDLNNWYAHHLTAQRHKTSLLSIDFARMVNPEKEEKLYLGELKDIKKVATHFDAVLFPIDGRIGNGYTRGARQFIDRFVVDLFVPMHFSTGGFESAWRMQTFTQPRGIRFWKIRRMGDSILI